MARSRPTQPPPDDREKGTKATRTRAAGDERPRDLSPRELSLAASTGAASDARPTREPPQSGGATGDGVGGWISNKKVTSLWSINQNRNVWLYIDGVGWKRLATTSDSAATVLALLTAHAKQTQSPYFSYREEPDGMIYECYVW